MRTVQQTEPAKFATLSAAMDPAAQAAIEGMMAYAQQVRYMPFAGILVGLKLGPGGAAGR